MLLIASLACTPLRTVFKLQWPARLRKLLGLLGFFYVCLHMLTYTGLDQGFNLPKVFRESLVRPFLLFGMTAFVLLIPLAITSTNGMLKKLGGKRWLALHRLVYLIVILGVVHFYLRIKGRDHTEPLIWGSIVAVLLMVRIIKSLMKPKRVA